MARGWTLLGIVLGLVAPLRADSRRVEIPLKHGTVEIHDLNAVLCNELGLPGCPAHEVVDLNSDTGRDFLLAVNACLWHGCSLRVLDNSMAELTLARDANDTIGKCEAFRRIWRVYTAETAPHATAAQARSWGLSLPQRVDPNRPLVVLIHGLDSDRVDCLPMGDLLRNAGQQIAYFGYPGDQPIADSADLLARSLANLHRVYPKLRSIDIVAHSMGGLVAREYVEGPEYKDDVARLILIAPPNHGSSWARFRSILSIQENAFLRQSNPDWHWTWLITEGLGQAGEELMPGSTFLKQLNERPRRASVEYTIVAGNKSNVSRVEGNCVGRVAGWFPQRTRDWWGFRQCYFGLVHSAERYHTETSDTDGPVSLASTKLAGVNDYVIVPADHVSIFMPVDDNPPAAWPIVRNRLAYR